MVSSKQRQPSKPRITEPTLLLMRLVWILISLTAITITVVGIAALQRTFSLPCELQGTGEICLSRGAEYAWNIVAFLRKLARHWGCS